MLTRSLNALNARRKNLDANEKGFTLIELLVVVIIIGILAAIAIPVYLGVQNNAKDSGVKSDVANLKTALVAYATDHNGSLTGATTATLGDYGYNEPEATGGNYGTLPAFSVASTGDFCVIATSVTTKKVGASDSSGVVSNATTACASGVFTK